MGSIPKKFKFNKSFKIVNRRRGEAIRNCSLKSGEYGIQALEYGRVTEKQLESVRQVITRSIKRDGQVLKLIFPHTPVTAKPLEVRMGGGKASLSYWGAEVKPGKFIYSIGGVNSKIGFAALSLGLAKLPFKARVVARNEWDV